jgi:tRNA(Ile)-lysidine synthase
MSDIEQHISKFIGKNTDKQYFVACSGGVDSMVLLTIFHQLNLNVCALHINYQLRGNDSEKDQALIEEFCKQKNIPYHIKQIDLQKQLDELGGNLQDEARKVRYSYFESFKTNSDCKIVLGHHVDDQIETFFLNLARNSGVMGLACMLPEHNGYIRPLLTVSKDEILEFAQSKNIVWREDVSNKSNKYSRNKLRNVILPALKIQLPTLSESVLTLTRIFQRKQLEISEHITPFINKIKTTHILEFDEFDAFDEFDQIELLRQLQIPAGQIREIEKLRNAIKGKRILLSNNDSFQEILNEGTYFYFIKTDQINSVPVLQIVPVRELPVKFSKDVLFLDRSKISGELKIRRWEKGDRMKPIGVDGSKLISDILNDAKIPNHLRFNQFVVCDDDKIVWCVGLCVSREAVGQNGADLLKVVLNMEILF